MGELIPCQRHMGIAGAAQTRLRILLSRPMMCAVFRAIPSPPPPSTQELPMSQVVIENPVINSSLAGPERHFRFSDEGITDEVVDGRRSSSYFVPAACLALPLGEESQITAGYVRSDLNARRRPCQVTVLHVR